MHLIFGLIAILLSLLITHCLLRLLETNASCKLLSFFLKGKPPIIYTQWLKLNENTLSFGTYKLLYSAINQVSLSPLGNLIFKSTALSGRAEKLDSSTTVLKLPFAAITPQAQKNS